MSWTYDPTLATDRDKVRFEIQDTEQSDQLFSDEEIAATLSANGSSVLGTTLALAKKLLFRFARLVDTTVGRVSESASQRFAAYKDLVARLEADGANLAGPAFGGTEVSKNDALNSDTGVVQPWEKRDETDDTHNVATFGGGGG